MKKDKENIMVFEKVLLVMTDEVDQSMINTAVGLCKKEKSKLYVLFVIDTHRINRLAQTLRQKIDDIYRTVEETGWQLLYLTEDEAVENGIWTSLHLEEGSLSNAVSRYVESYGIDIIIIKRKDEAKRIFINAPVPVIGL
ncbi:hypothetical protein A2Y85_08800 [candidate division WOR-3 bacterium RBG_13_43_14]|uniref:UspA domain-containing protein n=1 Tax=candidate division WOR-3 bacterium RBG_13_43_14 TaxID=1802590 RepID=A0A1F4U1K3_UNCW3|nr:MAG: hypothetical protein A2Y85_08800 [candidate division WOR-3 bacterium RBG_13_43_14]